MNKADKICFAVVGVVVIVSVAAEIAKEKAMEIDLDVANKIKDIWIASDAVKECIRLGIYTKDNEEKMMHDFEYFAEHNRFPDEEES